ncbi:hypothetical protein EPO66_05725, partial [bacterium]
KALFNVIHNIFDRHGRQGISRVEYRQDTIKTPVVVTDADLHWNVLFENKDNIENWKYERSINIEFPLNGKRVKTSVEIWKLKVRGAPCDSFVPLINLTEDVQGVLYPDEPRSESRATQAVFYTRAAFKTLEAMGFEADIFQVHEAFPAISFIIDLFDVPEFSNIEVLKKAKGNIMAFAHTNVPQAFPVYEDFGMIQKITSWGWDIFGKYFTARTDNGHTKTIFDPWYVLSDKSKCIGTVSPEHMLDMVKDANFGHFKDKYFYIEDSIWPFFWMLPEQLKTMGEERLDKIQLWEAKQKAAARFIDWIKDQWGIALEQGLPILLQARRIADYKYNDFINLIPGRDSLKGVKYLCGDIKDGGLGFLVILAGKAHQSDPLGQARAYQMAGWMRDPDLAGKYLFCIWDVPTSARAIPATSISSQWSIPPKEAAGMKDKKDMIVGAIIVSSYTGAPIQQILNVWIPHWEKKTGKKFYDANEGNGYVFESFSPRYLQECLEDASARIYAYRYHSDKNVTIENLQNAEEFPNRAWADLVIKYIQENPYGILDIMYNATRMLPVVDSRTAAHKYALVYAWMLGFEIDFNIYPEPLNQMLKDYRFNQNILNSSSPINSLFILPELKALSNSDSSSPIGIFSFGIARLGDESLKPYLKQLNKNKELLVPADKKEIIAELVLTLSEYHKKEFAFAKLEDGSWYIIFGEKGRVQVNNITMVSTATLFSHTHDYRKDPLPSIDDILNATLRNSRNIPEFVVTTAQVVRYHAFD